VAFRGLFVGEGGEGHPPLLFLDRVDGGVTLFQTAKKYFWETVGMGCVFSDLYIIYLTIP
jgi:hypothetical protein